MRYFSVKILSDLFIVYFGDESWPIPFWFIWQKQGGFRIHISASALSFFKMSRGVRGRRRPGAVRWYTLNPPNPTALPLFGQKYNWKLYLFLGHTCTWPCTIWALNHGRLPKIIVVVLESACLNPDFSYSPSATLLGTRIIHALCMHCITRAQAECQWH